MCNGCTWNSTPFPPTVTTLYDLILFVCKGGKIISDSTTYKSTFVRLHHLSHTRSRVDYYRQKSWDTPFPTVHCVQSLMYSPPLLSTFAHPFSFLSLTFSLEYSLRNQTRFIGKLPPSTPSVLSDGFYRYRIWDLENLFDSIHLFTLIPTISRLECCPSHRT